jgi:multiple sugar transport system permease protein
VIAPKNKTPAKRFSLGRREAWLGFWLTLPAIVALGVVIVYPFAQGIAWSFTDLYLLRGLDNYKWVGLENYERFVSNPNTPNYLRGTFIWVVGSLILQLALGLGFALLLHRTFRFRGFYRALILIPWVTPPPVAALTWRWILHPDWGVLNGVLLGLGLIAKPLQWLSDPTLVWVSLLMVGMWRHFPFWYVNLLAGLQSIPTELYEQAQLDGASRWQCFWYITLPMLRPILTVLLLLETIWRANEFALIWTFTEGGPAGYTTTLALATYITSFQFHRIGMGSAIGVALSLALTVVTVFYLRSLDKER